MNSTRVVGLTGQTGAGKSAVSQLLLRHGAYLIDADVVARQVTEPGTPVVHRLVECFSPAILREDGSLNRAALAAEAFASAEATDALNAIVHPAVIRRITEDCTAARKRGERLIVLDVPLLFQSGLDALCDITVTVVASEEVRYRRICERDGLTAEQAQARMHAQPAEAYYTAKADRVIRNDRDLAQLREQVERLWQEVTA